MDRVEILERGRDGEFERLCPDGRVYNLEVEDFHTYSANGIVVHNCHHATASSYINVINHFKQNPKLKLVGVTATPDRHDEEALGQIFETVAFEYNIIDGINDGWLVPLEVKEVICQHLDLSHVSTTAGDLNGAELAEVMEEERCLHEIVSPTLELAQNKKTLIFASSVKHAERITEIINRHKPGSAKWIHGGTDKDERRRVIQEYKAGDFQFLVNVGVFLEGFDEPTIEAIVVARPTKSRPLHAQMLGRGTRPLDGLVDNPTLAGPVDRREAIAGSNKKCLLVLDFVGNAGKHKLISAVDIMSGHFSDDLLTRAKEIIRKSDKPVDPQKAIEQAAKEEADRRKAAEERERQKQEEASRRQHIKAKKVKYLVAPINAFDTYGIVPPREMGWDRHKELTPKQRGWLEDLGIDLNKTSYTEGKAIIDEEVRRRESNLPSLKQMRVLKRKGYDVDHITREQAGEIMGFHARNGWKASYRKYMAPAIDPAALASETGIERF